MKNTIAVGGILGLKALTGDVPYIGSGNPWITYPRIADGGAGLYSPHSLWGYNRNIFDGYYNSDHFFDLYGNMGGISDGYVNLCGTAGRYGNICGGYGGDGNAGGILGGYSNAGRRYGNVGGIFGGYGNIGIHPSYQQYLNPRSLPLPSNFLTNPAKLLNSLTTTTKSPNPNSGRYYKGTGNPWLIQQ